MTITQPGIYEDFDIATYHADPCPAPSLSQSIAKILIDASPAHARYAHPRLSPVAKDEEEDEKYVAARTIGDVSHALILGRGKKVVACHFDNWRTKAAQTERDSLLLVGVVPVLEKHYARACEIAAAFAEQMVSHEVGPLPAGRAELVIAWAEAGYLGNFWFRSLLDHLSDDGRIYTDLKTTGKTVSPRDVPNMMASGGWDVQAAFIERGLNVLDPDNAGRRKFRFISIEQTQPYGLIVNELGEKEMTFGRKKVAYAVRIWQECLASGKWPAYPPIINRPDMPPWAEAAWLARESAAFEEEKND